MGDLRVHLWLGVVEGLAVGLLVKTVFINRYVQGTFPEEIKLKPCYSQLFEILTKSFKTCNAELFGDPEFATVSADVTHHKLEVAIPVACSMLAIKTISCSPLPVTEYNPFRASCELFQIAKQISEETAG